MIKVIVNLNLKGRVRIKLRKTLSIFLMVLFVLSGFYVNGSAEMKVNSESTNLIVNGGFEDELNEKGYVNGWGEGWRGIGDMLPERIKSEGHSGSFSASVAANYNCYIYTEFECEENTDYILTFWTKGAKNMACTVTPPFSPTGDQAMFAAGRQPENAIFKENLSDSTDWQLNTYSFNSGDNTKLSVVFSNSWSGSASNLFDDIEVVKNAAYEEALIKNGGFEDGTADWQWNNFGVTSEQVHSGEQALIVNDGTMEYQNTFQTVSVTPDTDYIFSFWYYAPNGGDWWGGWFVNGLPEGANPTSYFRTSDTTLAEGDYSEKGAWTQVTALINSGDYNQLLINFATHKITAYIDDVSVTVDVNPDNDKIIKNGGFEKNLIGWSYWNVNSTISDVAYEGKKSLLLAITESQVYPGFYQEFNVEDNTDYRLKFTYKGTGSWQSVWAVTESGMLTVDNALLTDFFYSKEDWTTVDRIFNSGEHTKLRIWFRGGVSSEIYLDAISIEKYEKTKPRAPEVPIISGHTQSSVTLNEVMGYEYSLDGINYSTNPTFTGLFTGIEYRFYQRIQADEFNLPSDASAAAVYKITAYGDANDDGEIKSDDIAQIVKVLFGSVSEYSQDGCDANGDKMIDIRDLVNLKKKLADNIVKSSFILFGRDISDYVIVYSGDDSNVQDGLNVLNTAVEGRSGQKLPVVSEGTENTPAIILNIDDAYADSYSVKSDINNCLSVSAGTTELIKNALMVLAERITEYPKEITLSITENYLLELD